MERVAISFSKGLNLCLHWQADPLPLSHLESLSLDVEYLFFGKFQSYLWIVIQQLVVILVFLREEVS